MRKLTMDDIILPFGLIDLVQRSMAGNPLSYFICVASVEATKNAMRRNVYGDLTKYL